MDSAEHGTDSALLLHLNCLEHAQLSHSPLFLSSWDIRRAFDSVAKEAMDASWRRLGVPAETARWIAHLDDQGPTTARSPWALEAWRRASYAGLPSGISSERPRTFVRALRALDMTDPSIHFHMPTHSSKLVAVSPRSETLSATEDYRSPPAPCW